MYEVNISVMTSGGMDVARQVVREFSGEKGTVRGRSGDKLEIQRTGSWSLHNERISSESKGDKTSEHSSWLKPNPRSTLGSGDAKVKTGKPFFTTPIYKSHM